MWPSKHRTLGRYQAEVIKAKRTLFLCRAIYFCNLTIPSLFPFWLLELQGLGEVFVGSSLHVFPTRLGAGFGVLEDFLFARQVRALHSQRLLIGKPKLRSFCCSSLILALLQFILDENC